MNFETSAGRLEIDIQNLIVAGWTGRDVTAVQNHIQELATIGVTPPSTVPVFYRVSRGLLTQVDEIDVLGPTTSGEVEPLLICDKSVLWLGLGSDHTDRELEAHSVAASKQACAKPVAERLWRFDEVANHLDTLVLRCEIQEAQDWVLYQEGSLSGILPLAVLAAQAPLGDGGAMLCGTLGAIGGVRPAQIYRMTLVDPSLGRQMTLSYRVNSLPVMS